MCEEIDFIKNQYNKFTIIEAKKDYTNILINLIKLPIYEGLICIDKKSKNKKIIYQDLLKKIKYKSDENFNDELLRIKNISNSADYFDDLLKTTIKFYIIVLSFTYDINTKIICDKYYEKINSLDFIKKIWIEISNEFFNYFELFKDLKNNIKIINDLIKNSIQQAIYLMLPMKNIVYDILNNPTKIFIIKNDENQQKIINLSHDLSISKNNQQKIINNQDEQEEEKKENDEIIDEEYPLPLNTNNNSLLTNPTNPTMPIIPITNTIPITNPINPITINQNEKSIKKDKSILLLVKNDNEKPKNDLKYLSNFKNHFDEENF